MQNSFFASQTFILQKLPIFSFPKPWDYQNQILRAILPRMNLLSAPKIKFFTPWGGKNRYHSFSHSLHIRPPMFKNSLFLAFPGLGDLKYGNYVKFWYLNMGMPALGMEIWLRFNAAQNFIILGGGGGGPTISL